MNEEIEKALRTALKIESDGARYYDMAAEHSEHKGVKKVFKKLADDEREHYQTILEYYERYTDTGEWPDKSLERTFNHSIHELDKVFTEEFYEGLKTSSSDLSAFSTGILLEEESIKFYKERVEKEPDYEAREFYKELVKIEEEHHRVLVKAEKGLIDKIWAHNRYSPY